MGLFREIAKSLGGEVGAGIQYTVLEGRGGYFQNVKRVTEFSRQKIVLRGSLGEVCVEGNDLLLGKYYAGDLIIRGEIRKVERIS